MMAVGVWSLAAVLFARFVAPGVLPRWNGGRVVCSRCGAREMRSSLGPSVLRREELASDWDAWWSQAVPTDHLHEWHLVGGLRWWSVPPFLSGVACTTISESDTFLGILPRFRDQELAWTIASRLAGLEPEERWQEIVDSSDLTRVEVLAMPAECSRGSLSLERQARTYAAWRSAHPRWHDLFPMRMTLPGNHD